MHGEYCRIADRIVAGDFVGSIALLPVLALVMVPGDYVASRASHCKDETTVGP